MPLGPEPAPTPRTLVVVLTYNSAEDLEDCLGTLERAIAARGDVGVVVVDNASTDDTAARVAAHDSVEFIPCRRNLGFAGGCNVGMRLAIERGCEYVYLLNPDTEVDPHFLDEAVAVADADPTAGAVQSLLLLHDEPDLVNTAGNAIHFLGFGYCGRYRARVSDIPTTVCEIAFGSGACVLLRVAALRDVGLFDEELFLYQEDTDLGWRLRIAGWRALLAPRSLVLHKYRFSKGRQKLYLIERNRLLLLGKNLQIRSLAVLLPVLAAFEVALIALAARQGWGREKLRATAHLLTPGAWRHIARERRRVASYRRVSDRDVAKAFTSRLDFDGVSTPLIERAANPALSVAWRILRPLLG